MISNERIAVKPVFVTCVRSESIYGSVVFGIRESKTLLLFTGIFEARTDDITMLNVMH
jgi:hypothetical protein